MNKLQELRAELVKQHEKRLAYIDRQMAILGPLLDDVEKLNPTHIYVDEGCANISLTGDKHVLAAAFKALRARGLNTSSRPEKGQSTYSAFFHPEGDSLNDCMVWLSFSSTQCRRVKVGTRTKTVEEDVYETVCDEQEYPEVAVAPPPRSQDAHAELQF
jgi:hypothetical protein